jgi:gamma-glutamyltranspeptidase/glutathione hydrolase
MNYGEKLGVSETGRRLYLREDSSYKRPGELVRNPDLAATLRLVARGGADTLYVGELGAAIAEDMRRHGGLLTRADLAGFAPEEQAPLWVGYRGRRIATNPPPGGGVMIAEMLRILERFDLPRSATTAPNTCAVLAEAMKIATRDKDAHVGDPRFVEVPLERLLSDAYADACAAGIRDGVKVSVPRLNASDRAHTTHVSAVDRDGMVVAFTHSLGIPSGVIVPGPASC